MEIEKKKNERTTLTIAYLQRAYKGNESFKYFIHRLNIRIKFLQYSLMGFYFYFFGEYIS